jgi:hypothetical protein
VSWFTSHYEEAAYMRMCPESEEDRWREKTRLVDAEVIRRWAGETAVDGQLTVSTDGDATVGDMAVAGQVGLSGSLAGTNVALHNGGRLSVTGGSLSAQTLDVETGSTFSLSSGSVEAMDINLDEMPTLSGGTIVVNGTLDVGAPLTTGSTALDVGDAGVKVRSTLDTRGSTTNTGYAEIAIEGGGTWELDHDIAPGRLTLNGGTLNRSGGNVTVHNALVLNGGSDLNAASGGGDLILGEKVSVEIRSGSVLTTPSDFTAYNLNMSGGGLNHSGTVTVQDTLVMNNGSTLSTPAGGTLYVGNHADVLGGVSGLWDIGGDATVGRLFYWSPAGYIPDAMKLNGHKLTVGDRFLIGYRQSNTQLRMDGDITCGFVDFIDEGGDGYISIEAGTTLTTGDIERYNKDHYTEIILNGGTLVLNGETVLYGTNDERLELTCNSGVLAGTGTMQHDTVIGPDVTVSPGQSVGLMTVDGTGGAEMIWAGGGSMQWEIAAADGDNGIDWDTLYFTDNAVLDIAATEADKFNIEIVGLNGVSPHIWWETTEEYVLAEFANGASVTGFDASAFSVSLTGVPVSLGAKVALSSGNLVVQFQPVPEPTTLCLLAVGGVGLVVRRRRR